MNPFPPDQIFQSPVDGEYYVEFEAEMTVTCNPLYVQGAINVNTREIHRYGIVTDVGRPADDHGRLNDDADIALYREAKARGWVE